MASFFSRAKDKVLNALKKTANIFVGSSTGLFMGIGASLSTVTSVGINTLWVKPVSALYDKPNRFLKGLGVALGIVLAPITAVTVIASYIPAIPIGAVYGIARGGQVGVRLPASTKASRCANKALETIIEDEMRITVPHEKNINKRISSWFGKKTHNNPTRAPHEFHEAEHANINRQRQNNANQHQAARQQPDNKGPKKARVVIAPHKIEEELPFVPGGPGSNKHPAAGAVRSNSVVVPNVHEEPVEELPFVPGGPQNKPSKKSAVGHKRVLSASLQPISVNNIANSQSKEPSLKRKVPKDENNVSSSNVKDKPKLH